MSTLTLQRGDNTPNLDGPNDLMPEVKTTRVLEREGALAKAKKAAKAKSAKKTTTTKSE
tara:strand:+ start:557 stop:733 length:177 start_codon:yes stop_codon:yes gene_type:complete